MAGDDLFGSLPVQEAARRAWTPTGPSLEELEGLVRVYRAMINLASTP